ncbi:MAG: hypothetical protein U0521_10130 [Anaerolineae bacterium]
MTKRTTSKTTACRLAIARQRLAGTLPASAESILDVVRDLAVCRLDPISAVARSHLLVLWSRLGILRPRRSGSVDLRRIAACSSTGRTSPRLS